MCIISTLDALVSCILFVFSGNSEAIARRADRNGSGFGDKDIDDELLVAGRGVGSDSTFPEGLVVQYGGIICIGIRAAAAQQLFRGRSLALHTTAGVVPAFLFLPTWCLLWERSDRPRYCRTAQ